MRHSLRAVSLWWLIVLVPILASPPAGAARTRNKAPIAENDVAITAVDTSVTINVTDNDSDRDGRIVRKTVDIVGRGPPDGTVVKRRNGKVTYTPNPGFSGQDTFRYRVKDNRGAWSNKARVQVAVGTPVITSLQEDSGPNKSDFITNDNKPTLSGTAATGLIEVTLYQDGTPVLPVVPVNKDGTWSYTYTSALPDGPYTFTATGNNAFGQESSFSAAKQVMVDTIAPDEASFSPADGCRVSENALKNASIDFPVPVPPLDPDPPSTSITPCLLDLVDDGIPVDVVAQQVDSSNNQKKIGDPYKPPYRVRDGRDGVLRMRITDPLKLGTYHLTFVVSDEAGNESCVESFLFAGETTDCQPNMLGDVLVPVLLQVFRPETSAP